MKLYVCHHTTANTTIEVTWAQVKEKIAKNNSTFKFNYLEKILSDTWDSVTVDNRKKFTDHCHNL
jgi:hypothetical protein